MSVRWTALLLSALCWVAISRALVLYNGLALTPPMGWSSATAFGCNTDCTNNSNNCVSDRNIRKMADLMVSEGYLAVGYEYLILEDCWMGGMGQTIRNSSGHLQPDLSRFPHGIKALADYVHSKGLKFGIFVTGNFSGRSGDDGSTLKKDTVTLAEWGVDYVKVDGSAYTENYKELRRAFFNFSTSLNKTGRQMVYSCNWPVYRIKNNGKKPNYRAIARHCNLLSNYNKTQLRDWRSIKSVIDYFGEHQDEFRAIARPGHWNDPGMLAVGQQGMTFLQNQKQMVMWAILAAPLFMSVDLQNTLIEDKNIFQNEKIIAVNQDRLGKQGSCVYKNEAIEIWTRPIEPMVENHTSFVIALLNRKKGTVEETHLLKDIGLQAPGGYQLEYLYGGAQQKGLRFLTQKSSITFQTYRPDVQMMKATVQKTQSPTTVQTTQSPMTVKTSQSPKTVQTTQSPTTVQTTQSPKTVETTQSLTTVQTTQSPKTVQKTQSPKTVQVTQSPKTVQTTQGPKTVQVFQSTKTVQTTQSPTTVQMTQSPKTEQTTQSPKTVQTTQDPKTVQTTQGPKTEQTTQSPKTVQTTQVPKTVQVTQSSKTVQMTQSPTTVKTTQIPTTVQTTQSPKTVETTQSLTTVQTTQSPKTVQKTQSPKTVQVTQSPKTVQTTQGPKTVQVFQSTKTVQTTQSPKTEQMTQSPKTVQTTQSPTTVKTSQSPKTEQTTQSPKTVQTTQGPKILQVTQSPKTVQVTQSPTLVQTTPSPTTVVQTTTVHTTPSIMTVQNFKSPTIVHMFQRPITVKMTQSPNTVQVILPIKATHENHTLERTMNFWTIIPIIIISLITIVALVVMFLKYKGRFGYRGVYYLLDH